VDFCNILREREEHIDKCMINHRDSEKKEILEVQLFQLKKVSLLAEEE